MCTAGLDIVGIFQFILGCLSLKLKHKIDREHKEGKQVCNPSRENDSCLLKFLLRRVCLLTRCP